MCNVQRRQAQRRVLNRYLKHPLSAFSHSECPHVNGYQEYLNSILHGMVSLKEIISQLHSEKAKERLEKIKESVPHDKDVLFKAKVRWDGVTDVSPIQLSPTNRISNYF